ncbi:unnamed protein product [Trichobilharzia szidati]|nr:unnamed protein product [Trichobilharzia szidati]
MTGLMYHRPIDHLNYLQQCIEKIKMHGVEGVRWDLFLQPKSVERSNLHLNAEIDDNSQYDPQPGISSTKLDIKPSAVIICIVSGPGVDKSMFSSGIIPHYPNFIYVNMATILKKRAKIEAEKKTPRWPEAVKMINSGEFLPSDMVLESFLWKLNQHASADGFIVDGYPRTERQYSDLKKHVNMERLGCVILLDVSEEFCRQRLSEKESQADEYFKNNEPGSVERRLCLFKTQTLPTCKLIDNDEKLRVVDGENKPDVIAKDILKVCEYILSGNMIGPETRPSPGTVPNKPIPTASHGMMGCEDRMRAFNIPRITPTFPDNGRSSDLYSCPIILLFGGPASGRTEQAGALCKKLPGLKHFNVTDYLRKRVLDLIDEDSDKDWDVIARRVHSSDPPTDKDRIIPEYWDVQVDIIRQEFSNIAINSRAVIVEGFPCHEGQLNTFNQHIGGVDLAILLDCEESSLNERLRQRYARLNRVEDQESVAGQRILFFKYCTLPVVRHYDERSKLVTIPGDREQHLVLNDLVAVVEYFLRKKETADGNTNNSAFVSEEVIPYMSQMIKDGDTHTVHQNNIIDDDKSLETSYDESLDKEQENSASQLSTILEFPNTEPTSTEVKLDNKTVNDTDDAESWNDILNKCKFIFILGCSENIRKEYCNRLVKQFDSIHIAKDSAMDKAENNDNILKKLLQLIKENFSKDNGSKDYIISGIPSSLKQAKEIEAFNDSLKFSNCKMVILLEKKLSDVTENITTVDETNIESELMSFLETTGKLHRINYSEVEDEIDNQLRRLLT